MMGLFCKYKVYNKQNVILNKTVIKLDTILMYISQ